MSTGISCWVLRHVTITLGSLHLTKTCLVTFGSLIIEIGSASIKCNFYFQYKT